MKVEAAEKRQPTSPGYSAQYERREDCARQDHSARCQQSWPYCQETCREKSAKLSSDRYRGRYGDVHGAAQPRVEGFR